MRRFEYSKERSSKFWEIALNGRSLTVHFGRMGKAGQTRARTLPLAEAARREHDALVQEKPSKGYLEVEVAKASAAPVQAFPQAKPSGHLDVTVKGPTFSVRVICPYLAGEKETRRFDSDAEARQEWERLRLENERAFRAQEPELAKRNEKPARAERARELATGHAELDELLLILRVPVAHRSGGSRGLRGRARFPCGRRRSDPGRHTATRWRPHPAASNAYVP